MEITTLRISHKQLVLVIEALSLKGFFFCSRRTSIVENQAFNENRLSTKSFLSNTNKSVAFSPTPINFTGI